MTATTEPITLHGKDGAPIAAIVLQAKPGAVEVMLTAGAGAACLIADLDPQCAHELGGHLMAYAALATAEEARVVADAAIQSASKGGTA